MRFLTRFLASFVSSQIGLLDYLTPPQLDHSLLLSHLTRSPPNSSQDFCFFYFIPSHSVALSFIPFQLDSALLSSHLNSTPRFFRQSLNRLLASFVSSQTQLLDSLVPPQIDPWLVPSDLTRSPPNSSHLTRAFPKHPISLGRPLFNTISTRPVCTFSSIIFPCLALASTLHRTGNSPDIVQDGQHCRSKYDYLQHRELHAHSLVLYWSGRRAQAEHSS